jgi:hypothetical protein
MRLLLFVVVCLSRHVQGVEDGKTEQNKEKYLR